MLLEEQASKGRRERVSDSHLVNVRRSLFPMVNEDEMPSESSSRSTWKREALTYLIKAPLPLDMPLLSVPDKLVRILDRDFGAAGIAKVDEQGDRWTCMQCVTRSPRFSPRRGCALGLPRR